MAVGFDAVGPSGGGGFDRTTGGTASGTATWTHTCGAGATELIVAFQVDGNGGSTTISSCTYNSVAMSSLGTTNIGSLGYVWLYGMANPPTGSAYTVSVGWTCANNSPTQVGGSVSFTGSSTVGSFIAGGTTSKSITITGTSVGNMILGCFNAGNTITGEPATNRVLNVVQGGSGNDLGDMGISTAASAATSTSIGPWTTAATTFLSCGIEIQAGATTATVTPVHVVQATPRRRRGIAKFLAGPVNPVPVPRISKVQRFPLRLRGVSKFLKGPITPVPQVPVTVVNTHRRRTGKIVYLRGPVNPVPEPNILVQNTHRRRRGVIQYLRGNVPAAVVPTPPVNVIPFPRARRRGTVRVLQGPVNPVIQPAVVVVATHRRRRGISKFLAGPVNPVPVPPVTVEASHRRRRGNVVYLRGTVPTGPAPTPVPPVNVIPIARARRRGHIQFLFGPVNPVPTGPVTVQNTHRRRLGRLVQLRGTVPTGPAPTPVPPVVVRTTAVRRRGHLTLLKGTTPAVVVPVPHITVVTPTHVRRRGILRFLKGPVNPVAVPRVTVVTPTHTRHRGVLRFLRGAIPTFGIGFLTAGDAIQNRLSAGEDLLGEPFGSGLFGAGIYGSGVTVTVIQPNETFVEVQFVITAVDAAQNVFWSVENLSGSTFGSGIFGSGIFGYGPGIRAFGPDESTTTGGPA